MDYHCIRRKRYWFWKRSLFLPWKYDRFFKNGNDNDWQSDLYCDPSALHLCLFAHEQEGNNGCRQRGSKRDDWFNMPLDSRFECRVDYHCIRRKRYWFRKRSLFLPWKYDRFFKNGNDNDWQSDLYCDPSALHLCHLARERGGAGGCRLRGSKRDDRLNMYLGS